MASINVTNNKNLSKVQVIMMHKHEKGENKAGVLVAIETTAGKHGGNANMFAWQWGKLHAQGHRHTAGCMRIHFNT